MALSRVYVRMAELFTTYVFYSYPSLFLGIIALGGIILIPALYLSIAGSLNLLHLFLLAIAAALTTDTFWYLVGRQTHKERLHSLPLIRRRTEEARKFSKFYEKHGMLMVFLAKFVAGTRIASQLLAGTHRMPFFKFIGAIAAGTSGWFFTLYALVRIVDTGVSAANIAARVQVSFLIIAVLIGALYFFTGRYVRRRWMS